MSYKYDCNICNDEGEYRCARTQRLIMCECEAAIGLMDGMRDVYYNVHGDWDTPDTYRAMEGDDYRQDPESGEWNYM